MIWKVILEGMGLGIILVSVCALGIRNGAVGMAHLYNEDVRKRAVELGLTTDEKIKRNGLLAKMICVPIYLLYVIVCVYVFNGARGFWSGFWQAVVILMIMNLTDRLLVDEFWVGHTKAWIIPGTEDKSNQDLRRCLQWIKQRCRNAQIHLANYGVAYYLGIEGMCDVVANDFNLKI